MMNPLQATTEFGVLVEIVDMDAFLSGHGRVRCRRLQDGEFIFVNASELVPIKGLSEADQPRELFPHRTKATKKTFGETPAEAN